MKLRARSLVDSGVFWSFAAAFTFYSPAENLPRDSVGTRSANKKRR